MANYQLYDTLINLGLLALGGVGILQLKTTKKDMRERNTRESVKLTGELCDKFANIIIKYSDLLDILNSTEEGKKFKKSIQSFEYGLNKKAFCRNMVFSNKSLFLSSKYFSENDILENAVAIINELEGLSIYFVKGVADIDIAYYPLSESYCAIVESLMPVTLVSRCEGCGNCANYHKSYSYENMLELYTKWKARLNKDMLDSKLNNIKSQLESFEHLSKSSKPIGTDN